MDKTLTYDESLVLVDPLVRRDLELSDWQKIEARLSGLPGEQRHETAQAFVTIMRHEAEHDPDFRQPPRSFVELVQSETGESIFETITQN